MGGLSQSEKSMMIHIILIYISRAHFVYSSEKE